MTQIYTGDGKGKTTAAIGLTIRALGAGKRVYFAQFMKGLHTSELNILSTLSNIIIDRSWDGNFIVDKPTNKQIRLVKDQYRRVLKAFNKNFDLVVCDEIIVAMYFEILSEDEILYLIKKKPKDLELILTGRGATKNLIQKADLVTQMKKIKHYFDKGLKAREGIEF